MFSEAEQNQLHSFLNEVEETDTEPKKQNKSRKRIEKKKPYSRKETDTKSPGRARKAAHELLSEDQKKANHIASEQKRRANIKIGFDQLVASVPSLDDHHRSESLILQKSVNYIRQLIEDKSNLQEKVRELQLALGETPDDDNSSDDE
ncbi:hypothetical protein K501DRAFT_234024 [Backusella circina FSU 941]|nr:hypothetical protein K501DRAFT_234024 [Backusella circina FSU 941]